MSESIRKTPAGHELAEGVRFHAHRYERESSARDVGHIERCACGREIWVEVV